MDESEEFHEPNSKKQKLESNNESEGHEHDHAALIKDPIHGSIELHPLLHWITKTPIFHRLKNIKQLSGLHYVYPGGTHTRFEHSIGVCFLAGEYARMLITKYRLENKEERRLDELEEDDTHILCIQIAGLCHDLGHGPFSHLFEPNRYNSQLSHEKVSCLLVNKMYNENKPIFNSYGIKDEQIKMIQNMIKRSKDFNPEEENLYLYQIVANAETGIDVDKWDYFIRDCHYIGLQHEFDCKRLMQLSKIQHEKGKKQLMICYNDKEINNLLGMFRTRCSLHLKAYQHKRVRAVNHMLKKAIEGVIDVNLIYDRKNKRKRSMEDILKNLESDLDGYLLLDDGIIQVILNTDPKTDLAKKHQIEASQKLLTNLIEGKNIPRRLSPEKLAHKFARNSTDSQSIFHATCMHQKDLPKKVIKKLGLSVDETNDDEIFVEKVKLSYISEEGTNIKDKAEVLSASCAKNPAPVCSPLEKVYVYKNDLKGGKCNVEKDAHRLEEKEYEETLQLFIPKWYKMERCWWYTTLNIKDDDIIGAIADIVNTELSKQ